MFVLRKAEAEKLPAGIRVEKAPVSAANVIVGSDAGATAYRHLVAHELAIVFAQRTGQRLETRDMGVGG